MKGEKIIDSYVVRNDLDWPARVSGSLSLRDILEVAKAVPELGIAADATLDSRGELALPTKPEQQGPAV